jgi:hypothetical protein
VMVICLSSMIRSKASDSPAEIFSWKRNESGDTPGNFLKGGSGLWKD